jgi:hypothetical protein
MAGWGWGYGDQLGMIMAPPPAPTPAPKKKATTPLQKFLEFGGHDSSGAPDAGGKTQYDPVMGGSNMARNLGIAGSLLGPLGTGALGAAIGTNIDVGQTNRALATQGGYGVPYNSRGNVKFGPAFANAMSWGMLGTSPLDQAIEASIMDDTGQLHHTMSSGGMHAPMGSMDYDELGAPGAPTGGYADNIDYSDPGAYAQTDEGDWY